MIHIVTSLKAPFIEKKNNNVPAVDRFIIIITDTGLL